MITALDHIAIAVPDFEKAIKRFMEDFGLPFEGTEDVVPAKTSTAFFPLPPTNIELVHPLNGLHHLCFRSDNIEEDVARLKAKGYQFLSEAPTPGAHNSRVIFIHPRSCDGVLIEINQPGDEH